MDGAPASVVQNALAADTALPGTCGFAGELDGRLVRDVLGRKLCYYEREHSESGHENSAPNPGDAGAWSNDPDELANPTLLPAGHVRENGETRRVWSLPDPPTTETRAIERVRTAFQRTLSSSLGPNRDGLAVAFSGGVDSALLAATTDTPLYVVGYGDATDLETARDSAAAMGRAASLRVCELALTDIESAVVQVARATGRTNAMDIQIALPLYLVAVCAAEDGFERLALGQGADELFGGYAKIANAPRDHRVDAATVRGAQREVLATLPRQLERDIRAVRAAGVEPVMPLLCDDIVRSALTLPAEWLVDDGIRKRALREAARTWLPDSVATREKKAVQYGTLVAREVDRLARQAGFKRRMENHIQQYVESRL